MRAHRFVALWSVASVAVFPISAISDSRFLGLGPPAVADVSNGAAVVVGTCYEALGEPTACRWTDSRGWESLGLGESFAFAVSADGSTVVGEGHADELTYGPWRWMASEGAIALFPGVDGFATDVSADGAVVVGHVFPDIGRVFRWTADAGGQLIGVAGTQQYGISTSADGSVVVATDQIAYRWTEETGIIDLEPPPGFYFSAANDVSPDGAVTVGIAVERLPDGSDRVAPVRWNPEDGLEVLELLPGLVGGSADTIASGSIVGGQQWRFVEGEWTPAAVLWDPNGRARLFKDVLEIDHGIDLTGWTLEWAQSISPDGSAIVGFGTDPNGAFGSWLAILSDACRNGEDDDGDGAVDFPADAGCESAGDDSETVDCANGADDDRDGVADALDPGCADATDGSEKNAAVECDDGLDNDGDGFSDHLDSACSAPDDPLELGECQNGVDDDGDGFVDLGDAGCDGALDAFERAACEDGVDGDGDGLADFPADPGCPAPFAGPEDPACDDGLDNDGDGFVDFADSTCSASWPYWEQAPCGLGAELVLALGVIGRRLRRRGGASAA